MGLFSRTSQNEDESFDDIELPSSTDLKEDPFKPDEPALDFKISDKQPASKLSYGVEDAIRLMKSLPRDNNEVVVTVVKKTLESTKVRVQDVIADASAKEERIRNQHKRLESEIKNLQDEIAQRNQRISELLEDLKETTDVRQRLQLALELDPGEKGEESKKAAAPKPTPAPAQGHGSYTPSPAKSPAQTGAKATSSGASEHTSNTAPTSTRDRSGQRNNRPG